MPLPLALALAALAASPDDFQPGPLDAPPRAEQAPTAYACTLDTLLAGRDCVFEGEPGGAGGATLGRVRAEVLQACARAAWTEDAARPDAALRRACEARVDTAARRCAAELVGALTDTRGHFTPAARACYEWLGEALQRTQADAALAGTPPEREPAAAPAAAPRARRAGLPL